MLSYMAVRQVTVSKSISENMNLHSDYIWLVGFVQIFLNLLYFYNYSIYQSKKKTKKKTTKKNNNFAIQGHVGSFMYKFMLQLHDFNE